MHPCKEGYSMDANMTNADLSSLFVESTYHIRVQCFPNNEIAIRLNPWVKDKGSDWKDIEHKITALKLNNALENGNKKIENRPKELVKDKSKIGWGELPKPREFSKKIQKSILRRVASLQAKYGRENMRFLTMTLPGSTEDSMKIISKYSAYIVNRINRFCSNIIGKDAQNRVQVWELQKRGALHNHLVIASLDKKGLELIDSSFKNFCYQLFSELSKMTNTDMFARASGGTWKDNPDVLKCDSQVIRKDVASYLSKYISKTNSKINENPDNKIEYYPSRWATWGRGATKALQERTWRLEDKRVNAMSAEKIVIKAIECSEKYGQEKYKKPLVYLDRIGYGVNIKAYVKPEYLEDYMKEIEELLVSFDSVKNPLIDVKQVGMNKVYEYMLNWAHEELMCFSLHEKYLDADPRRWQKAFRKNPMPIPT